MFRPTESVNRVRRPRWGALLGAAAVQGAVLLALIHGLAFTDSDQGTTALAAFDVSLPPASTPPPPPDADNGAAEVEGAMASGKIAQRPPPVVAPEAAIPLAPASAAPPAGRDGDGSGAGSQGAGAGGGGQGDGLGGGAGGSRAQRIAGALRDSDYPAEAARVRAEGMTAVQLVIGTDGRIEGCSVMRSSGYASLDDLTCRLVRQRFRYRPARDANGRAVPETVTLSFTWGPR